LTIYHAGDTALFRDMELIGELYKPELAMLPIGDRFTMGPREAAHAIRFLGVKHVIPMHYATFPFLTGTPDALRAEAQNIPGLEIHELKDVYKRQVLGRAEALTLRQARCRPWRSEK